MNSKKRCLCCGKYYQADKDGSRKLPVGWFADDNHVMQYVRTQNQIKAFKAANKAEKEKKKERAKQKRDFKAQDTSFRRKAAQKAFNAYIRKRDEKLGCISCDKPRNWQGQWHAGHLKTVGARGDIRFNEDNVNKQCSVCNNHLSGNVGEYEKRLIERIGKSRVEALTLVKQVKRTAEDYKAIEVEYKQKLKELNEIGTKITE